MAKFFLIKTAVLLVSLVVMATGNALAGGYAIPHQTARALGLSNAMTAGVNDPSAVYYNPAALSEVEGNNLLINGSYINVINSVKNRGRKARNKHEDNFIPTIFGNFHVPGTDFTLGIGSYVPFGLATTYDDSDFTRFAAKRTELKTLYVTPAVSWHPSKYFSVGGGFSFIHSSAVLSRSLCFVSAPGGCGFEGKVRLTDTANAYAFNLGLLLKPHEKVKIGVSYRGRADLKFDTANVKFNALGLATSKANVRPIPLPPVIDVGLFVQPTRSWGVEFVYEFTRWSQFNRFKASFSPVIVQGPLLVPGFNFAEDWNNTSTLRLGSFYRLNKNLEFRGGITVEESPIPNRTLNPAIPGADLLTLNTGLGYKWRSLKFDLGYMAVFYKTRRVSNVELEGIPATGVPFLGAPGKDKYETFNNFISFTVGYQF
ncbi:MAG: OmpP1/FadL family transporter [Candidatus Binatia bacterium]